LTERTTIGDTRCSLTAHFKRVTYLVEPGPETLPLGGKRVQVREWEDGRVEIQCEDQTLPYSIFDKNPHVAAGAIVENKRLGALLAVIQAGQGQRDQTRLASRKLTLRQKDRIRAAGKAGRAPGPSPSSAGTGAVAAFLDQFEKDQRERTKTQTLWVTRRRSSRPCPLRGRHGMEKSSGSSCASGTLARRMGADPRASPRRSTTP
jgi:hypothetical protein